MKMLNIKKSLKSKGFTLIELLIAVGFIAVASAGVYYIYNKVKSSQDANTEARNLDAIRAGIKNLYASSNTFGEPNEVTNLFVNQARITPDGMRDSATTGTANSVIKNKFGGNVEITPQNLGTGTNNAFRIRYNAVPGEVCVKLVTSAGAQFDRVVVGSTDAKAFGSNIVNPVTTATACNGDQGQGVIIDFYSL